MAIGVRGDGRKFISVFNGKLEVSAREGEKDATSRVTKTGKTKWVKHFDFVSGIITGVEIRRSNDYGDSLIIKLDDNKERFSIDVGLGTRHAQKFIAVCENINLRLPVTFSVFSFMGDKGKEIRGWTIENPEGEKLESSLNKDDIPPPVQNKKGKWDFSDREVYLEEHLSKWIASCNFSSPESKTEQQSDEDEDEMDDIAF